MADGSPLKQHLLDSAAQMRPLVMGVILILMLRFRPQGLIPGK
jgi:branched-chain amino acid transport system permease protein